MNGPSQLGRQPSGPPPCQAGLFPLPNVVLFPGAVLPLHIFEERYKRMTADALLGDGLIAMGLLRPGWEKNYHGRAAIEPVVCVGRIMAHERLPDGKYNLLLQGQWRAKVIGEAQGGELQAPYRLATTQPLEQTPVMEIDLADERRRLIRAFSQSPLAADGLGRQFARLLAGPAATVPIADLIAFNYIQDIWFKQSLLADGDVQRRVGRVVGRLNELQARLGATSLSPASPGPLRRRRHDPSLN
jgi:uncharacterized protein